MEAQLLTVEPKGVNRDALTHLLANKQLGVGYPPLKDEERLRPRPHSQVGVSGLQRRVLRHLPFLLTPFPDREPGRALCPWETSRGEGLRHLTNILLVLFRLLFTHMDTKFCYFAYCFFSFSFFEIFDVICNMDSAATAIATVII